MHKLKWTIGVVAVLFSALNFSRAADDETYDLRGPAPKVKQVFVTKGTLTIKDADTTMKFLGMEKKGKLTMVVTSEEEAKVLAVKGREVIKCQTKIIKEQAEIKADIGGIEINETESTPLEKEIVISERTADGKWKHLLVDTQPSAKQKKELNNRNGIENDDDLYPKEKVKVGHKWTVEAAALQKLLGNSFTDVKGKISQQFMKVEDVNQEKCAVIQSKGKITGKMKEDGEPNMDVEMDLTITTWKSLETGIAVKEKFEGKIKISGVQKMDDLKIEITMSGPVTGDSTTKLKPAK
ncbi:MAG: hypothetical protein L0241_16295 [Planctomycetia bacterium]|nr:hypothetical protein [Planctomycetia bacterium]